MEQCRHDTACRYLELSVRLPSQSHPPAKLYGAMNRT